MIWNSLEQISKSVHEGSTTATQNVRRALDRLQATTEYNSVISVLETQALAKANIIDRKVKNNEHIGQLAGVPFIAKDNFLVFGSDTTAASNILKNFKAPYQSTVIDKLESEGAICIAKANLDAFGHGGSTENSDFGPTLNPVDKTKVPGGSSGGSSTVVTLGIVPFALGTDTGGSSRQPASFSGCIGYKPTYGLLSRSGIVAMASSTDTVGLLTKSVDDLDLLIKIMSGRDPLDGTTIDNSEVLEATTKLDISKLRIGVIKQYTGDNVEPDVTKALEESIATFKGLGATVTEVSLPSLDYSVPCYYILVPAEVSSNLSRYDGQRFGFSSEEAKDLDSSYQLSRSQGFGAEPKRRILIGTYVLSSGYYESYYKKAQLARTKIIDQLNTAFGDYDFLISPTTPSTAFRLGQNTADPLQMYLADSMTVGASLAGIPALVLPTVKSPDADHMPIGLQILANQKQDKKLIEFGKQIEKELLRWN